MCTDEGQKGFKGFKKVLKKQKSLPPLDIMIFIQSDIIDCLVALPTGKRIGNLNGLTKERKVTGKPSDIMI